MGGFADEDAAQKWLEKNGVSVVAVRHTGKACFADLSSEDDVTKAAEASDETHRLVYVVAYWLYALSVRTPASFVRGQILRPNVYSP